MNKVTDTGYMIVAKFAEGYDIARIWPDKTLLNLKLEKLI